MKLEMNTTVARRGTKPGQMSRRAKNSNGQIRFKSLLVAVDFSKPSMKALENALGLASEFGAQVRLIHVLEPPTVFNSEYPAYARWDRVAIDGAKVRLDALINEKIDEQIPVNSEVRMGRAYKLICVAAKNAKSDLIVIGTHGFTGLKRLFLGSTAEKVIRHAPCSVLIVRSHKNERNGKPVLKPKKILAPTDFSGPSKRSIQAAATLAKQYNAELQLLNVVPIHYAVADFDQMDYAALEADLANTGKRRLAQLSKGLSAKNISVATQLRRGRPATEITEAAKDKGADLILISTHGHTGWERALLGSTTEEVVRHATCPVLVVRNK
jgi:nucleotide-binding universal stress UspA family protein